MSSKEPGELLSTKEMAARYGVARSTFLLWYHSGIVPAETQGKKNHRFDGEKVETALRHYAEAAMDSTRRRMAATAAALTDP